MYLASPSFQESMNCRHLLCLDAFKNFENRKPINHFSLLKEPVSLDQLSAWEKEYIKMPIEKIFSLLKICNFLQIKGLLRLMIKAVALQIQGKQKQFLYIDRFFTENFHQYSHLKSTRIFQGFLHVVICNTLVCF